MAVKVAVAATILSLSLRNSCKPVPSVSPASLIPGDRREVHSKVSNDAVRSTQDNVSEGEKWPP